MAADPVALFTIHDVPFRKVQASAPLLASGASLALPKPQEYTRFSHATQLISQFVHFTPDVDPSQFVAHRCQMHCHFFGNFVDSLRSDAAPPNQTSKASPTNTQLQRSQNGEWPTIHHGFGPTL